MAAATRRINKKRKADAAANAPVVFGRAANIFGIIIPTIPENNMGKLYNWAINLKLMV